MGKRQLLKAERLQIAFDLGVVRRELEEIAGRLAGTTDSNLLEGPASHMDAAGDHLHSAALMLFRQP